MNFLVNIDVDDLETAIRFYTDAFGLRIGRRFGASAIELVGGPTPIYLLVKAPGSGTDPAGTQQRTYERHWTPVHIDFVVEDIERSIERAQAAGAKLEQPVSTSAWGRLALMADPFGHGFCFVQFVGAGYDEIASKEHHRP